MIRKKTSLCLEFVLVFVLVFFFCPRLGGKQIITNTYYVMTSTHGFSFQNGFCLLISLRWSVVNNAVLQEGDLSRLQGEAQELQWQVQLGQTALRDLQEVLERAKIESSGHLQSVEQKYASIKRINLALENRIRDLTFELETARAKQQRSSLKGAVSGSRERAYSSVGPTNTTP